MTVSSPSQSSPKSSNTRHQTKLRFQLITSIKQFQTTALHNWQVIRAYPDAFSLNEFQLAFPDAIYWISVGISKNKAAIPLLPMQHGKNRNINLAEQLCLSEGWTSSLAQISAADYSPFRQQNPIVATFRKGISATATFTDLLSIDGILPCTEGCSRSSLDKAGGARTFAAGTTGAWNSGIHSISISSWSNSRRNGSSSSMINLVFLFSSGTADFALSLGPLYGKRLAFRRQVTAKQQQSPVKIHVHSFFLLIDLVMQTQRWEGQRF
jgi:hypothetical protein